MFNSSGLAMADAGDRIGRFSIGGALAALGVSVAALSAVMQKPDLTADETWGQMLTRLWDSPTSTAATIVGLLLVLVGGYIMALAAIRWQSQSTPSNED